jgi:Pectinacetylesterase
VFGSRLGLWCLIPFAGAPLACGSDVSGSGAGGTGGSTTGAGAGATTAVGGSGGGSGGQGGEPWTPPDGDPISGPDLAWTWVDFPEALCRDGSSTGIGVNFSPTSDKVMIYLEGGGACFNGPSCFQNPSNFDGNDFGNGPGSGIFDRDNPANPVADWNYVYVPYCTGDVHAGDNPDTMVNGAGGVQQFVGYANVRHYLQRVVPTFLGSSQVLLTGVSAGGFGAAATTALTRRLFGPTPVTLLDDSGPPFSTNFVSSCLLQDWRTLWNFDATFLSDCGDACGENFLVDFATFLGSEYPDEPEAVISSRGDNVIRLFYGFGENDCSGGIYSASKFSDGLDDMAGQLSPGFGTYFIQGQQHTWIGGGSFYNTTVAGVPLTSWVADLVAGEVSAVAE